ncbi:hypothetical protein NHX12_006336 [Muraenolepis orangiensis]|uniref:Elongator complex protein 4 n=1 Tax=Muraenolepis orangiensis TaxID=630683 RepID=A0A9Q0DQU6_9TELE|nr:hypothetical protein NHX12_006336 [Muraenolepis orangiensis]
MAAPMNSVGSSSSFNATTSFQKKTRSKLIVIPGTRPSVQNGQLIVSTGVTSLDYLIGGGLAVGTVLLIEEDRYNSYSHMVLKYFMAEGVLCGHELFLASAQDHPDDTLQELPAPILDDIASHSPLEGRMQFGGPHGSQDAMKIAWRYQNLPKVQSALASSSRFGHYYDVSKKMEPEIRRAANHHAFYLPEHSAGSSATRRSIVPVSDGLGDWAVVSNHSKSRNVLRIGLQSLGSALWGDDLCCRDNPAHGHALTTFLYGLRALLRSSLSVAVLTVPSHLIQSKGYIRETALEQCSMPSRHPLPPPPPHPSSGQSDPTQFRAAQSMLGSLSLQISRGEITQVHRGGRERVPRLNCLLTELPDHKDLAFKLKRKQFTIETHLCSSVEAAVWNRFQASSFQNYESVQFQREK